MASTGVAQASTARTWEERGQRRTRTRVTERSSGDSLFTVRQRRSLQRSYSGASGSASWEPNRRRWPPSISSWEAIGKCESHDAPPGKATKRRHRRSCFVEQPASTRRARTGLPCDRITEHHAALPGKPRNARRPGYPRRTIAPRRYSSRVSRRQVTHHMQAVRKHARRGKHRGRSTIERKGR